VRRIVYSIVILADERLHSIGVMSTTRDVILMHNQCGHTDRSLHVAIVRLVKKR